MENGDIAEVWLADDEPGDRYAAQYIEQMEDQYMDDFYAASNDEKTRRYNEFSSRIRDRLNVDAERWDWSVKSRMPQSACRFSNERFVIPPYVDEDAQPTHVKNYSVEWARPFEQKQFPAEVISACLNGVVTQSSFEPTVAQRNAVRNAVEVS